MKQIPTNIQHKTRYPINHQNLPLSVNVGNKTWSAKIGIKLITPSLPAVLNVYAVWSVAVQAFVPSAIHRLANLSSIPLWGCVCDPKKTRCSRVCGSPSSGWCHAPPSLPPPPLDSVESKMCREQIGSSVVTTNPRKPVAGERNDWMAVGDLFSLPRMEKSGEEVTLQEVPDFGPWRFDTVVDVDVIVVLLLLYERYATIWTRRDLENAWE